MVENEETSGRCRLSTHGRQVRRNRRVRVEFSLEEPLIAGVAPVDDDGATLASGSDSGPGDEHPLLDRYSTIVSRYYDGLWIRILSIRINPEQMQTRLQRASDETVGQAIIRMPRSSWPAFDKT